MTTNISTFDTTRSSRNKLNIALWVSQVILAGMFAMAGAMKTNPTPEVAKAIAAAGFPEALVRFIGISELAGALGLILPAATRIKPGLTPLSAAGLVIIMVLATALHISRGELQSLPVTLGLGGLALFVAWGRYKKVPVQPRH
jgi:putative oxidoreductase